MAAADVALFEGAAAHLKSARVKLSDKEQLRMYALFKQGTTGPCNTARPGMLDFVGKAKWDAWKALGDMDGEAARKGYVELVDGYCPGWRAADPQAAAAAPPPETDEDGFDIEDDDNLRGGGGGGTGMGPSVSTLMMGGGQDEGSTTDLCYFASQGDSANVRRLLDEGVSPDFADEEGQTGLHFAADRGHIEIMKDLIERGASVNAREDNGQTCLHYASAAGNLEACRLLKGAGADVGVKDEDGATAGELADSAEIKTLLA